MKNPMYYDKILQFIEQETDPDQIQIIRLQAEELIQACVQRENVLRGEAD